MKVILLADVDRLGKRGDVVTVRDGYARNFLFPRKLAMPGTTASLAQLESIKSQLSCRQEQIRKKLVQLADRLDRVTLKTSLRMGREGAFGAVTTGDIAGLLAEHGYQIDKHSIVLEEPIRAPGTYDVVVKLGYEVTASVKLWVVEESV
ncbi:MAG: 50S ribosomal protein L9 [candidate division WOR-3 bacterium]